MAALFNGSSQYYNNTSPPITGVPFSVGFWAMFTTAGTTTALFTLCNNSTLGDNFAIRKDTANKILMRANVGTSAADVTVATADTINTWFYVVARFISATNRKMAVLHSDGLIEHAASGVTKTPPGVNELLIGAVRTSGGVSLYWPGRIAEMWWTNADIQPDGAQLDDSLVRQLAYHGPFSVPKIVPNLIEYHKMRRSSPAEFFNSEDYYGRFGPQLWTDNGSVKRANHPPLPYEYTRPTPVARMLMI